MQNQQYAVVVTNAASTRSMLRDNGVTAFGPYNTRTEAQRNKRRLERDAQGSSLEVTVTRLNAFL